MGKALRWAIVVALIGLAAQAAAADKINVLIIDGQHNHAWKVTTPVVKDMLLKTERFAVDVLTTPDKKDPKEAWEKFKPDFPKYGVVLMNYSGQNWPKEVETAFEKYMQDGGGLVFYHAAVFAFPGWAEWNKMMGMGWRGAGYGDRVYLDEAGKLVREPKGQGPGGSHGPAHPFEMTVRDKDNPIMKGMPEKWSHVKDELYHGMRGPAENMTILATAFDDKQFKGTGFNEPIVWTVPYGKGRVFVSLLGHDVPATTAPGAVALLCRGTEWAATGQVTIPVPEALTAKP